MTSAPRLIANRVNAQKSTGPRTATGKAQAARNNWRHGLRTATAWAYTVTPEIQELAR